MPPKAAYERARSARSSFPFRLWITFRFWARCRRHFLSPKIIHQVIHGLSTGYPQWGGLRPPPLTTQGLRFFASLPFRIFSKILILTTQGLRFFASLPFRIFSKILIKIFENQGFIR
jgi:hypothetical protein